MARNKKCFARMLVSVLTLGMVGVAVPAHAQYGPACSSTYQSFPGKALVARFEVCLFEYQSEGRQYKEARFELRGVDNPDPNSRSPLGDIHLSQVSVGVEFNSGLLRRLYSGATVTNGATQWMYSYREEDNLKDQDLERAVVSFRYVGTGQPATTVLTSPYAS